MAQTEVMKRELLLSGYFREMGDILNQNIPTEITQIIISFQSMPVILGVGKNYRG